MAPATWVLLRGLTRERRHWGDFAGHLGHAMPGVRVVAIDLPGNGEANRQRSPWSIDAMAEHARKSLRTMKLDPPYRVLAMSMGGMVATAWAANHREEIDAAVLVNTSMKSFNPYWQRLRPHNYASLFRLMLSRRPREAEARVLRMTSRLRRDDAALLDAWVTWRRERPMSRVDALAQLWASARFRAPATCPFTRVLLLTSERDELVDTRCSIALSRAWGCQLASHPRAGHDIPLDDPQWVTGSVSDWLATPAVSVT